MNLSEGNREILDELIENGDYITGYELSKKLKVSTKTIYRRIKNLRDTFGVTIIEGHSSKGYKVNYEIYLNLLNDFTEFNRVDMSVESRRMSMLLNLLVSSPEQVTISGLSEKYYVSESSIVNDLNFIEEELKLVDLSLSKTNRGTSIIGSERDIRRELMHMFNDLLLDYGNQNIFDKFSLSDVNKVKEILNKANDKLEYQLENPYYINLLTHLLILLKRHKKQVEVNQMDIDYKFSEFDQKKFDIAKEIINRIEEEFEIAINPSEINYVYTFIVSARKNRDNTIENEIKYIKLESNSNLDWFVSEIIDGMEEKLNIAFSRDEQLKNALLLHTKPMLNRIRYNIIIVNPLVNQIKTEFPNTFYSVKKIILKLKNRYGIGEISDDEIGYIAVYFQNTIEKVSKKINVLIVCTTGIGTSHLLKTRINNNFPLLNVSGVISVNEISSYKIEEIDLILTTVNLEPTKIPQLLISAFLNKKDINIINQFIKKNYGGMI